MQVMPLSKRASFLFLVLSGLVGCPASPGASPTVSSVAVAAPQAHRRAFDVRVTGNPKGRPMILIPGLSCGGNVWAATAKHYQATHRLHVVTLAGFGGVPALEGEGMLERMRRDLVAYIDEQRLDHPILVGHSMGAFLSYWVAATAPTKVGEVVAVDGLPFLSAVFRPDATAAGSRPGALLMRERMASLTQAQYVADNRRTLEWMIQNPNDVERVAKESSKSDPRAVAAIVYELMTTDLRNEVAKVRVPVLQFAAAGFAKTDKARADVLERYESQLAKVPDHKVSLARSALHFVMLDDPDFFFAEMDAFLAARPRLVAIKAAGVR